MRLLRMQRRLGQRAVCESTGLHRRTICRIEHGELAPPPFERLMWWLDALEAVEPLTAEEINRAIFLSCPRRRLTSGVGGPANTLRLWRSPTARRWFAAPEVPAQTLRMMKEQIG